MPRRRAILVEFVGVPASGKTTTAKATASLLESRGLRVRMNSENIMGWMDVADSLRAKQTAWCRRRHALASNALAGIACHPRMCAWTVAFACSVRPLRRKNLRYAMLILGWVRRTAPIGEWADGEIDVLLQDEGAYHLLTRLAMFGDRHSRFLLRKAAKALASSPPRLVAFAAADSAETVVRRQAVRQGVPEGGTFKLPGHDAATFDQAVALREEHQRSVQAVMAGVRAAAPDLVLELDTSAVSVEKNAQAMADRIVRELHGSRLEETATFASPRSDEPVVARPGI